MTTHTLYGHGRQSAAINDLSKASDEAKHTVEPHYVLISDLRAVRQSGDEAMTAVEEYDPNFAIKLSSCTDPEEATRLLDEWLSRRVGVLRDTQSSLRAVWEKARGGPRTG